MDLRVERTYHSLAQAFMALLEEKNFEDISVAELCDKAMIRRTTFYKHFADKNEFLVFFVKEVRDEFAQRVEKEGVANSDPVENCVRMLRQTLDFLNEHGKLVDNALASRSAPMIIDALGDVIQIDTLKQLEKEQDAKENAGAAAQAIDCAAGAASTKAAGRKQAGGSAKPGSRNDDLEMVAMFWAGGVTKMLRVWCEDGRPAKMEQRMVDMVQAARPLL